MSKGIHSLSTDDTLDECILHMQGARAHHLAEEKTFLGRVDRMHTLIKEDKHRANCAANSAYILGLEMDYAKSLKAKPEGQDE